MSTPAISNAERVRRTLIDLTKVVREMTPAGAKKIPQAPQHFNFLARPHKYACRICGLAGHHSSNVATGAACRAAILSLINFWADAAESVKVLYQGSSRFAKVIVESTPTYEMRLDEAPPCGGNLEKVVVDGLTRNYLKFLNWFARIRAKAVVLLSEGEMEEYERVTGVLNDFLLHGKTLSDLFEISIGQYAEK